MKSKFDETRGLDELMRDVATGKAADRGLAETALAALGSQARPVLSRLKAYENDANPELLLQPTCAAVEQAAVIPRNVSATDQRQSFRNARSPERVVSVSDLSNG